MMKMKIKQRSKRVAIALLIVFGLSFFLCYKSFVYSNEFVANINALARDEGQRPNECYMIEPFGPRMYAIFCAPETTNEYAYPCMPPTVAKGATKRGCY